MTSQPRPDLEEAARRWLEESAASDPATESIRAALDDFVEKRFRGAAAPLRQVHERRLALIGDPRPLAELSDASPRPGDHQTLGQAAAASAPPDQGRLLFHLMRAFSPATVVEMGTNLGISAAYLALGLRFGAGGHLTSVEGSGVRLALARGILHELGVEGVELVEGDFDRVLGPLLDRLGEIQAAFVDGNHRLEATVRYFESLSDRMPAGGVVVLDDIRWSVEMLEAWNRIRTDHRAATAVDLGRTGLVVVA